MSFHLIYYFRKLFEKNYSKFQKFNLNIYLTNQLDVCPYFFDGWNYSSNKWRSNKKWIKIEVKNLSTNLSSTILVSNNHSAHTIWIDLIESYQIIIVGVIKDNKIFAFYDKSMLFVLKFKSRNWQVYNWIFYKQPSKIFFFFLKM